MAASWETIEDFYSPKVVDVEIFRDLWNRIRFKVWKKLLSDFLIRMWPYIIVIDIKKIFSPWGPQHGGWKKCLQSVLCIYMSGCVISRCQIYNCSSLFARLWPGACEWARFAFLGSCALSIKGFSLLLCRQHGLNCIASETFLTLKQGHRKYSLRGGSWEERGKRGSEKGREEVNSWISHFCCFFRNRPVHGIWD